MANAAFLDVELDLTYMQSDPEKFMEMVYEKADELKAICRADHSISALTSTIVNEQVPASREILDFMDNIYKMADDCPIEMMPAIIHAAEKMLSDLRTQFKDRVIEETANRTDTVGNKRVAQAQYKALREAIDTYVRFMNTLQAYDFKGLPALPGNFGDGPTSLKYYTFIAPNKEDRYRNHKPVADIINKSGDLEGRLERDKSLMDFVESYHGILTELGWQVKEFH